MSVCQSELIKPLQTRRLTLCLVWFRISEPHSFSWCSREWNELLGSPPNNAILVIHLRRQLRWIEFPLKLWNWIKLDLIWYRHNRETWVRCKSNRHICLKERRWDAMTTTAAMFWRSQTSKGYFPSKYILPKGNSGEKVEPPWPALCVLCSLNTPPQLHPWASYVLQVSDNTVFYEHSHPWAEA